MLNALQNRESRLAVFYFSLPLLVAALLLSSCGTKETPPKQEDALPADADIYTLEVLKDRKTTDLSFIRDDASPISLAERESFHGLEYYPVSKAWAFATVLQRLDAPMEIVMATSKDKPRQMYHIGYLPFTVEGKEYKLSVFTPVDTSDGNYWFIPFHDATSGKETYGGGRYIDIQNVSSDSTFLDFNYAYNPYCAYNSRYDCPIPPDENRLPIAITAGEKYKKK